MRRQALREQRAGLQARAAEAGRRRATGALGALVVGGLSLGTLGLLAGPGAAGVGLAVVGGGLAVARRLTPRAAASAEVRRQEAAEVEAALADVDCRIEQAQHAVAGK
jgi:hypothetical protein